METNEKITECQTKCDKDFTVRGMLSTAYSAKLRGVMIVAWVNMIIFIAIAVWSIAAFVKTDDIKTMILAAAGFTMSMIFIAVVKLWVCQAIYLANLKCEIRCLEKKLEGLLTSGDNS